MMSWSHLPYVGSATLLGHFITESHFITGNGIHDKKVLLPPVLLLLLSAVEGGASWVMDELRSQQLEGLFEIILGRRSGFKRTVPF